MRPSGEGSKPSSEKEQPCQSQKQNKRPLWRRREFFPTWQPDKMECASGREEKKQKGSWLPSIRTNGR
ncbi:hypothetical protein TNCT_97961 [Trichonephila clavata]|uniref:Uncharacterized protein n=1 Tax=Trichonephila clavata TaxID=2740835 RepID=A0A8X6GUM1_TRICU|nr:hypothetical protein TNCT_97961 [Trichonephila clavata]